MTIFIIFFSQHCEEHYFNTNSIEAGTFLPLPKKKNLEIDLGEDSFLTSPVGLVVCDGVGGTRFSSKYFSLYLTVYYQKALIQKEAINKNWFYNEDSFAEFINRSINTGITAYKKTFNGELDKWIQENKLAKKEDSLKNYLSASSTFVSASIVKIEGKERLIFASKGDSRGILFRRVITEQGSIYYLPFIFTTEGSVGFNFPLQIDSEEVSSIQNFTYDSTPTRSSDIVLLGSDGVFDNIHFGFLVLTMNAIFAFQTLDLVNESSIFTFLKPYVHLYAQIVKRKEWVVYEHYYKNYAYSMKKEYNLENKPDRNSFRFLKSFFNKLFKKTDPIALKIEENQFEVFMIQREKEMKVQNAVEVKVNQAFMRFFRCPVIEMISFKSMNEEDYVSPCIQKILESDLNLVKTEAKNVFLKYNAEIASFTIAKIAKLFSEIGKSYPSNFSIKAWKEKVFDQKELSSGKPDDITAVVAMVRVKSKINTEPFEKLAQDLEIFEKEWENRLKKDVIPFLRIQLSHLQKKKIQKEEYLSANVEGEDLQNLIKENYFQQQTNQNSNDSSLTKSTFDTKNDKQNLQPVGLTKETLEEFNRLNLNVDQSDKEKQEVERITPDIQPKEENLKPNSSLKQYI